MINLKTGFFDLNKNVQIACLKASNEVNINKYYDSTETFKLPELLLQLPASGDLNGSGPSYPEYSIDFPIPFTSAMKGIITLHDDLMCCLILIAIFVMWMLFRTTYKFSSEAAWQRKPTNVTHGTVLEIVWTIIPSIILMLIAIPSFGLLYMMDDVIEPGMTIKINGHQWYWSYEYPEALSFKVNDTSSLYSANSEGNVESKADAEKSAELRKKQRDLNLVLLNKMMKMNIKMGDLVL